MVVTIIKHPLFASRLREAMANIAPTKRIAFISSETGCVRNAARLWLHGGARPSRRFIDKLAKALEVDPHWLQYGLEKVSPFSYSSPADTSTTDI